MDQVSGAKNLLDQVNRFKEEIKAVKKKEMSTTRNNNIDEMILNLGNPRLAEKLRIQKVQTTMNYYLNAFSRAYFV